MEAAAGGAVTLPYGPVGVVGAGTMGSGIAQVAAVGGFDVLLFDVADGAAAAAVGKIGDFLNRSVERARLDAGTAGAAIQRIQPVDTIEDLAGCFIVIEAVAEKLEIKQDLFGKLAALSTPETVFATNTSSLPVTAIASTVPHPERVVGMHFFNPVPLMKLVEVIAGMNSDPRALKIARGVATQMQREPINANDGPGFLVNRVSRPFLLEAQKLLQERVADHEKIDRIVRLGGGFRMGPFELSDLVGIDVGYDIAQSFYALGYNEPRWQPSGIPARMIAAGRLGRKSGQGYYTYPKGAPYRHEDPPPQYPESASGQIAIIGRTEVAGQLRRLAQGAGYAIVEKFDPAGGPLAIVVDARAAGAGNDIPKLDAPVAVLCAGSSLATAARGRDFVGFHCLPPLGEGHNVEITTGSGTSEATLGAARHFFHSIGKHIDTVSDAPGLVLGRIVCQLINEASFAIQEGVGSPTDIDKGVQLGLSYPRGLLAWADMIGLDQVLATIDGLQREIGGDRYRAAPLLRRMVAEGHIGRSAGRGFYEY
jgi:3-hydroxybutyryl-CoA dehydrogenase